MKNNIQKFDFNYVVSSLPAYVNQTSFDWVLKTILADPTMNYISVETDVWSAKDIHIMENTPVIVAGDGGFSGFHDQRNGSDTFHDATSGLFTGLFFHFVAKHLFGEHACLRISLW